MTAVGLGMLYALDLGVARGLTPRVVAEEVERVLPVKRSALTRWLAPRLRRRVEKLLAVDKKGGWLVLEAPGRTRQVPFP